MSYKCMQEAVAMIWVTEDKPAIFVSRALVLALNIVSLIYFTPVGLVTRVKI